MRTNNININCENLSYLDSEKGDTTLLFIHGAFISKEYWNNQLSYFSQRYRVVAIDLAGHGKSSHNRTDWTVQNYGKDISEFIKELSLENIIIVGHSFGADVMLEIVRSIPSSIKGLVDIDQFKNVGIELPQKNIDQFVERLKTDFANTCQQYAKEALLTEKTNPELVSRLLTDYGEMKPEVGTPLLKNTFSYTQRETKLLKGLQLKLYLLHVNYSSTNEENLKKYVGNNYELHIMSATCHYPMLENPNEFNASLEKILLEIKKDQSV